MTNDSGNPTWMDVPSTLSPIDAAALNNLEAAVNTKAPKISPAFVGSPTAPTQAPGTNDETLATTAFATALFAGFAPLASPVFTGNPTAPTPTAGDNDTSIATTAFVVAAITAGKGSYAGVNAQTGTTYSAVLSDVGKLVTCNNAAAITVTLPKDATQAVPVGSRIDFAQLGAGKITFAAESGATVNSTPTLITRAQYSATSAVKIAADTWLLVGDMG